MGFLKAKGSIGGDENNWRLCKIVASKPLASQSNDGQGWSSIASQTLYNDFA